VALAAAAAGAVDINVAEDEAKKAEASILAPQEGEGYYDSAALAELALAQAHRSPSGAMWRSFAVPGWGQIYNRKYYKAPFVMAAQAGTLYMAIKNYATARDYLGRAHRATDPRWKLNYNVQHQEYIVETEFWGWLFVGCLAYSMMDAYVDAHLADWDVEDLPAEKEARSSRLDVEVNGAGVSLAIGLF